MFARLIAWSILTALAGLSWPVAHAQNADNPKTDAPKAAEERVQTVYIPYTKLPRSLRERRGAVSSCHMRSFRNFGTRLMLNLPHRSSPASRCPHYRNR